VRTRGAGPASLKNQLIEIVDALSEAGVPYMIIGAFALAAWGRPRATLDLDFMIQTSELPQELIRNLAGLGFHFDTRWERYNPMMRSFHKRFRSGRTAVDLLLNRDAHDQAAFSRRKRKRFDSRYLWFPSPEDLLLQKLKVGRPQDLIDAAGIIDRMGGRLNQRYLALWANKLGCANELAYVSSRK